MEKRKYIVWYWLLTVISILVFIAYVKISYDLRIQGAFTSHITVSKIIMSILWAAILVERSNCYLRSLAKKSDQLPEFVFLVLGVAYLVWIALGTPTSSSWIESVAREAHFLNTFLGITLANVIIGLVQLKKKKKIDGETEDN